MSQDAGEQANLKRAPDTEIEGPLKDGEPPLKKLKTEGEEDGSQDPIVPTVNTGETPSASEKKVEAPKPVSKAAPRDIPEVISETYLSTANLPSWAAQHKAQQPSPHSVFSNFLKEDFMTELVESLNHEDWFQHRNDVCTLEQTGDLKSSSQVVIKDLVHALTGTQFRELLSSLTGLKITAVSDLFGDIYKEGMASKRIAFFLFLGPDDWQDDDGGHLELFKNNDKFQPTAVEVKIQPKLNTLVVLETTPNTFYQISEVLSKDKELMLISGLVRCTSIVKAKPYTEPTPQSIPAARFPVGNVAAPGARPTAFKLEEWINPDYLTNEGIRKLCNHYERHGSLGLNNFLLESKYKVLEAALAQPLKWRQIGPANRRQYETLGRFGPNDATEELKEFELFLKSKPFVNGFLEKAIGTKVCYAQVGEYRRFNHRDYTLSVDSKDSDDSDGLDLLFSFTGDGSWSDEDGGCTTFMEGKDELLTLIPTKNTLSLVLREPGATKYVKYQGAAAPGTRYDLVNTFLLAVKDDDEGEDYDEAAEEDGDSEDDDILEDSRLGEEALQKPITEDFPEDDEEGDWDDEESY